LKFTSKKKILILGSDGLVGSSVLRKFQNNDLEIFKSTRKDLDLRNEKEVFKEIDRLKPHYIINAAAKVGSLTANINKPQEFLDDNLRIQMNVFNAAAAMNVEKILNYASVYIYPEKHDDYVEESDLLSGRLNENYEYYALAKIVGIKILELMHSHSNMNSTTLVLPSVYGPNDSLDPKTSRIIASTFVKLNNPENSQKVSFMGSGNQIREFIYSEDVADASIFFIHRDGHEGLINIGNDEFISVREIVLKVRNLLNYRGEILWTANERSEKSIIRTKKNKMINCGWKPSTSIDQGLDKFYFWYKNYVK